MITVPAPTPAPAVITHSPNFPFYKQVHIVGHPDWHNIRALDECCVPMIRRMHKAGIAINIEKLHDLSSSLRKQEDEYRRQICEYVPKENLEAFTGEVNSLEEEIEEEALAGITHKKDKRSGELVSVDINLNSGEQIADLLYKHLDIGRGIKLKMTKAGDRVSTDKKQLESLKDSAGKYLHPVVGLILQYREVVKLRTTYTEKMPMIARYDPRTGTYRLHTQFVVTRTATGRLASRNPNLQNLPFKTELGRMIRECFIPSPGCVFVSADFSQIELRCLAHCAADAVMMDIYRKNGDIHVATAMAAFNKTEEEVKSEQGKLLYRLPCKTVNFGIVYGLSKEGLQQQLAMKGLNWSLEECQRFIDRWFDLYPGVKALLDLYYQRAKRFGLVWDVFGRTRLVPEVASTHSWIRAAGLRQAGNMPIQSMAQGFTKLAMAVLEEDNVEFRQMGYYIEPLLQIHDEILQEAQEDIAEVISDNMTERMSTLTNINNLHVMRVPILGDAQIMRDCWKKAA